MKSNSQSVKMLAIDIDGTMIRSDGTLSDRVRSSLHRAEESGIRVVPATGRPESVTGEVIDALGIHNHWVFSNGAITRHVGRSETIRAFWMDSALAETLIQNMRERLPGVRFALELENGIAYEAGFESLVPNQPPVSPVNDVLGHISGRVQKVLAFRLDSSEERVFDEVTSCIGNDGVVSYTGLSFVQVAASLVTKAAALAALCEDYGISSSQVATFGDNHNDISMLEWSGRSFAMENSSIDAAEAADQVIGSNDSDSLACVVDSIVDEALNC